MSNKPTYQGFLDFVQGQAEQYPDRRVEHESGWSFCVVGDYLESFDVLPFQWADNVLKSVNYNLYEFLNGARNKNHGTYQQTWLEIQKYI